MPAGRPEADEVPEVGLEVSGKRGISAPSASAESARRTSVHPLRRQAPFDEVEVLADRYLEDFLAGQLDRLDVAYTRFEILSRQYAVVETLCRWHGSLEGEAKRLRDEVRKRSTSSSPRPTSILEEVVPACFKVKLFKCFLDAAVSEQIARMVAMKAATENADSDDQQPVA